MSKPTTFEKIAASVPQNATAGRVVSQRGEHYEPKIDHGDKPHSATPIATRRLGPGELDLTGRRFGRLVTIGRALKKIGQKTWVVRCVCGSYELRSTGAIKKQTERPEKRHGRPDDRCDACWHLEAMRLRYKERGGMSLEELAERSRGA